MTENRKPSPSDSTPISNEFISALSIWTEKIRAGDFNARLELTKKSELSELSDDINFVAEMLASLSRNAELQLLRHTEHIAQKNKSLATLYDVVTSINMSRDLNDLLTHFLHTTTELVNAHAAGVYLANKNEAYTLVAEIGLDAELQKHDPLLPRTLVNQNEEQTIPVEVVDCPNGNKDSAFDNADVSILVIPLQYRGALSGMYNLYINRDNNDAVHEYKELFTSIGRHLGIAVEKARLDEEANSLSIIHERTNIANELHDSLAQTLASLKYQVRVLDESIHQGDEASAWQELERVESTIDEAHTELRALIAHFRLPIGESNITVSAEQIVERFKQDCGDIQVFFQQQWPEDSSLLPPQIQLQVLRIIQEALTNIRKHSEASTVRVLMRGDEQGHYTVLVEDDGKGITEKEKQNSVGEHVGLSVMQDRARRIGGTLEIESEPGEGVIVRLEFDYLASAIQDT